MKTETDKSDNVLRMHEMRMARLDAAVRVVESFNAYRAAQKPTYPGSGQREGYQDDQCEVYEKALKRLEQEL
jgi:hypothetical protein